MAIESQESWNTTPDFDLALHKTILEAVDDARYQVENWIASGECDEGAFDVYLGVLEDFDKVHANSYNSKVLSAKYLPQEK